MPRVGIYKITNLVNNDCYVGQSINMDRRLRAHFNICSNNPKSVEYDTPLHRAIRKYGVENFKAEILEECLREDLNAREIYWVDYYHSYIEDGHGYNLTRGGDNPAPQAINSKMLNDITLDLETSLLNHSELADKYKVSQEMIQGINTGRYWYRDSIEYPIRKYQIRIPRLKDKNQERHKITLHDYPIPRKIYSCIECGAPIGAEGRLCLSCYKKLKHGTLPEDFEEVCRQIPNKKGLCEHYQIGPSKLLRWLNESGIDLKQLYREEHPSKWLPKTHKHKVGCYESLDAEPIIVYKSMKEASDACGVRAPVMIKQACESGQPYHGYYWKFID